MAHRILNEDYCIVEDQVLLARVLARLERSRALLALSGGRGFEAELSGLDDLGPRVASTVRETARQGLSRPIAAFMKAGKAALRAASAA
jgi:hypothetical protein